MDQVEQNNKQYFTNREKMVKKNITLVIMAAGIGSRFGGGIKQLEPVGPNGELIMDYSIHDALEAGCNKVVFIIRKDIEEEFEEMIGNRVEKLIPVEYVFQSVDELPNGIENTWKRTKPWGTGQAVLCIKYVVKEPFIVINADDYYGKEAFKKLYEYMANVDDTESSVYDICMAGFILSNTLSENGGVTRGICSVDDNGYLRNVKETYEIQSKAGVVSGCDDAKNPVLLQADNYVSMNMWGLPPKFLDFLEDDFAEFLCNVGDDAMKKEYLLPKIIDRLLTEGLAKVKVLETNDKWFGVTYKEDKPTVVAAIRNLIEDGVYPENLF